MHLLDEGKLQEWWRARNHVHPDDLLRDAWNPETFLPDSLKPEGHIMTRNLVQIPWGGFGNQYCSTFSKELAAGMKNPALAISNGTIMSPIQELVFESFEQNLKYKVPEEAKEASLVQA